MIGRIHVLLFLAGLICLSAGCIREHKQDSAAPTDVGATQNPVAEVRQVTLHVKDMIERQGITWITWRNEVQEALVGLQGVKKVDCDMKNNLLHVRYDPGQTNPEQMLKVIDTKGYEAKVVPQGTATATS